MNSPISLNQLYDLAVAYKEDCNDRVISPNTSGLHFDQDHAIFIDDDTNEFMVSISDLALKQICNKLQAPDPRWMSNEKKCPKALKAYILNDLLFHHRPMLGDWFVRMKSTTLRAVLTTSYSQFDNDEMIGMVRNAANFMKEDAFAQRYELNDRLDAYILFPKRAVQFRIYETHELDTLHPAIHASNSEVGDGCTRFASAVYTRSCNNGMIWGWKQTDALKQRHLFVKHSTFVEEVAKVIDNALQTSQKMIRKLYDTQVMGIPNTYQELIYRMCEKFSIVDSVRVKWIAQCAVEKENTRSTSITLYNVINAATFVAQQYAYETRQTIERVAGFILENESGVPHG